MSGPERIWECGVEYIRADVAKAERDEMLTLLKAEVKRRTTQPLSLKDHEEDANRMLAWMKEIIARAER